jgi:hypothetical protein
MRQLISLIGLVLVNAALGLLSCGGKEIGTGGGGSSGGGGSGVPDGSEPGADAAMHADAEMPSDGPDQTCAFYEGNWHCGSEVLPQCPPIVIMGGGCDAAAFPCVYCLSTGSGYEAYCGDPYNPRPLSCTPSDAAPPP